MDEFLYFLSLFSFSEGGLKMKTNELVKEVNVKILFPFINSWKREKVGALLTQSNSWPKAYEKSSVGLSRTFLLD